jgi:hypothetical protein
MAPLILKRAPIGRNPDDFDVLEDGAVVGRIFLSPAAPRDRQWMWASGHNGDIRRSAHGYEPTARPPWRRSRRAGGGGVSLAGGFFSTGRARPRQRGLQFCMLSA